MEQFPASFPPCPSLQRMCMIAIGKRLFETMMSKERHQRLFYLSLLWDKMNRNFITDAVEHLGLPVDLKTILNERLVLLSQHVVKATDHLQHYFGCDFYLVELPLNAFGVMEMEDLIRCCQINRRSTRKPHSVLCNEKDAVYEKLKSEVVTAHFIEDRIPGVWVTLSEKAKEVLKSILLHFPYGSERHCTDAIIIKLAADYSTYPTDPLDDTSRIIDALTSAWGTLKNDVKFVLLKRLCEKWSNEVTSERFFNFRMRMALFLMSVMIRQPDYDNHLVTLKQAAQLWRGMLGCPCFWFEEVLAMFESVLIVSLRANHEDVLSLKREIELLYDAVEQSPEMSDIAKAAKLKYDNVMGVFEKVFNKIDTSA